MKSLGRWKKLYMIILLFFTGGDFSHLWRGSKPLPGRSEQVFNWVNRSLIEWRLRSLIKMNFHENMRLATKYKMYIKVPKLFHRRLSSAAAYRAEDDEDGPAYWGILSILGILRHTLKSILRRTEVCSVYSAYSAYWDLFSAYWVFLIFGNRLRCMFPNKLVHH